MDAVQRSTLVVGVEPKVFDRISKMLKINDFLSDFSETGGVALESISFLPFDAIVAACPLPDMPVSQFLDAVRGKSSPCRQSAVVLLAAPGTLPDAEALVGRGANRALSVEELDDELAHELSRLLEVPPRFPMRTVSRLKVQLSWGTSRTMCQTENVSAHGMLIKTDHPYPVGTQMAFELAMPGDAEPVRGYAVVVRQTQKTRERASGVGVRFSSFESDDKKRFEVLLQKVAK
jgi:uncharacterized protein (TIGR02266 family)